MLNQEGSNILPDPSKNSYGWIVRPDHSTIQAWVQPITNLYLTHW